MTERKHGRVASARAGVAGGGAGSVQLRHVDTTVSGQLGHEVVRVLLLEDRDTDAELVERALRKAGFAYTFERARSEADFLASLDPPPHVIISDYYVPGCDALHALRLVRSRGLDIPFILVSGVIGEARALEAMRLGATDFLLKDRLGRLGSAMRTALELAALRRKANGARQKLERSENEFREAFDNAAIGMALTTLDGHWLKANAAFAAITGYTTDELRERDCAGLMHPDDVKEDIDLLGRLIAGKISISQREQRYIHKQGHAVWVQVTASLARDGGGKPLYRVLQVIDSAERRQTEARLARANRARKVMAECSHALVHATEEQHFLQEMCRIVVDSGGYVQAYVGIAQKDQEKSVSPVASAGFEEGYLEQARRSWKGEQRRPSVMGDVIASGQRFISRDIFADAKLSRWVERARSKGYQSLICLPLRIDERCIGGISIYAREPDAFDHEEIELLETLAGDISYGIAALRARATLGEQEEHFRATFEQTAVGVGHTTTEGRFLQANSKLCEMLGYSREELLGLTTRDLTHPDDRDKQDTLRLELLEGRRSSFAAEKRYVRNGGSEIWVNRTVTLSRPPAGEPYLIQVIEDVTERKRTDARLERLMRARRVMAECNHTLIHAADETEMLQNMCRIVVESGGYKMAWVGFATGDPKRPVHPAAHTGFGDDAPMTGTDAWNSEGRYLGFMGKVIATGEPHIARDILHDDRYTRRRGRAAQHGFQSSIALPLKGADSIFGAIAIYAREADAFDDEEIALLTGLTGDIAYGIDNLRMRIAREEDITETKRREERYRAMFDNAAVGITRVDLNGALVDVNQKFCDLLGYTRDELCGKAIRDVTYPEDFGQGARFRTQLAQGEARSASGEKRFVRKDGAVIWARRTMSTVLDEAGKPQYVISVVEDISERKRAEEALRTSEEVLRATFSQAAVGIFVTTPDSIYLQVNDKYCDMLGYTRDELLTLSIKDVNRAEDIADVLSNREKLVRGELNNTSRERQLVRKDGSLIWVSHSTSLARDQKGDPLYFITVAEDVTERKEVTERYRATFDSAPVGIMHTSMDGDRIVHANSKLCEMLGYTHDQLLRMSTDALIHPDYVGVDRAHYRDKMLKGEVNTFSSERLYKRRDGSNLWVNRTVSLARDTAGKPLYFIRVIEDIGERKRAEQAVASERALLRTIIDTVPDYIYVKDAEGRFRVANRAWLNERNAEGDEIVGKTVFDVFSPPELARRMADQDAAIVKSGAPILDQEQLVSVKAPDGKPGRSRWTSITKVPMRDASGNIIGTVGISRDITEQKLSARRGEMEHAVTRMLSEPGTLDQAMRRILRAICEDLEWACGAHWQWDESAELLRCVETWCVDAEGVAEFAAASRDSTNEAPSWQGGSPPRSQTGGLIRSVWQSGAPVWFPDVTQRPDFRRGIAAAKADLHCAFGFPILAGEKPLGVMEFYGRDIKEPDEALLQMVRAIGSQVGQFIQRKEAEQALRVSEERYRDQFEASPLPMWVWDDEALRFLTVNQAAIDHYGYTRDEFLRMSVRDIWAPDEGTRYEENLQERAREHTLHLQRRHRTKDGRIIDVEVTARRFISGGRDVWLTLVNDVSERLRAEQALLQSEEQFRQLANNIPQVFWITDVRQKQTLYLSPAAEELIGKPLEEIRMNPRVLIQSIHNEDRSRVYGARRTAAAGGYDESYRIVRPDGTIRWVHDRAFPVRDAAGDVYRIAGIAEDITERKLAEERLMHLAHYDVLTSLPNRVLFYDRLRQALAHAKRNQWTVGVMLLDVDRFKNVNDTLGHAVGDRLLQQVSERLTRSVRAGDTVGRLGGDEFAIVLSNLATAQDGNLVAQKIMASFKDPFGLEGGSEIYVTASIGITLYPDDSTDQDTLIKNADAAMYRAKDVGRNAYRFYTPEMNARALELLSMESSLRGALDRREFLLYYQPKASLTNGEIVGVEALLRWRHPERGLVSPGEFIPVMEETGLIVPVGEWVVRAVCAQISEWQRAGVDPKSVAINLSARQFVDKDLGTTIKRILEEYNIDPQQIEFEITESSLMANTEESIRTLELLGHLGVGLSIDDFGTGYSSLGYLKRFPLDALKIDRSFVRDITTSTDDATITRAIISMAHSLGLKVIAEGVETEEQLTFLAEHGCDECQGYYFSRPLPADECARWLTERRALARPAQPLQPGAPIVLLVDDDNDALSLFKRALTKDAYRILTASSAHEGLEVLGRNKVDVVISDQNMPGIPGMEFLRRVRSLFPDTMRMMTSAHSDPKEVADAVGAGEIFRFLPKSLDEEQFRADVRDALQQKGR